MESLKDKIKVFLDVSCSNSNGSGDGSGYSFDDGYGYGSGDGSGYGSGDGSGYGYVDGYGYGYVDGYVDGYGIRIINNQDVYIVDNVQTIITHIKNNVAKGFILNKDLTLTPCYICKGENKFAHGTTLREANMALQAKLLKNKTIEERIKMFKDNFPDFNLLVKNSNLYEWHHILTGSCKMGRDSFAQDHEIDVKNGSMTVNEFIALTKNSYNGKIIKQLIK